MILSELSVRRPVFAMVVSLLLTIIGLMAANRLSVREYPDISAPIVSVATSYRGATAEVVESKITQIIESQVAGLEGVEKITSSSSEERSRITIEFGLGRDIESAANDVRDRVSRVQGNLPDEADPPEITKVDANSDPVMHIDLSSDKRSVLELNDYADRYLLDRFSIVDGVAMARINGERRYAMRIWLNRQALAGRALTVQDVETALRRENLQLPAGRIESVNREFSLRTDTGFNTEEDFRQLVIGRGVDGSFVRLGEVAEVKRDAEDLRSISRSDGVTGISFAIVPTSTANVLDVTRGVQEEMARIRATLPEDIRMEINVDNSLFVHASINEVIHALVVALILVLVVIYAFLGTWRATLIPAITIPVSIIAAAIVMVMAGFSINVLTLLGAVLAIGLVVDDAIVVLENIMRRIEEGEPALLAAVDGSREIGFAVVATTLVLIAVFLPISYLPGNLGRLFGEFGITIAAAIAFSALISLTLVPMMTSKFFARGAVRSRTTLVVERFFHWLSSKYEQSLRATIGRPAVGLGMAAGAIVLGVLLYKVLPTEYAPTEDRANLQIIITAPEGSSLAYLDRYLKQVEAVVADEVTRGNARRILTRSGNWGGGGDVNLGRVVLPLTPWEERTESATQIVQRLRAKVSDFPGARVIVTQPGGLGVRGGSPVRLVLGGSNYEELAKWRDIVLARAAENPGLVNLDSDYYERKPQLDVAIDRNRAADLGVSLETVGRSLETMMGSRIVTTYLERGEEYRVILQARESDRATPGDLENIYVRSLTTGAMIPLSNLVKLTETAGPIDYKRFDRLRAVTISASLSPGYSLGEAVEYMEKIVREDLPPEAQVNWDGESREFQRSGSALYVTFLLSLTIVFLVLAAQFESFRHPLIIMVTVPLAITGALIGLWVQNGTINVFSQIGCIMLIGLAAKNGILIVEFANQLRDRGMEFVESIIEASAIRLRPVLMTSLCTLFGAVPLMIATGAGAESRQAIGAVVVYGVAFSLLLTLYVVPTVYALIARRTQSPEHVSRLIEHLRGKALPSPSKDKPAPTGS
ncbi:MAG TPA: efflux RND transporter permease subunit [Povalibacter sp.]|uniref:efflux RND transporter permease subunit n=1 Tax=Povalibacter sp. TaxID=1962978 RepID=UPI002C1E5D52|nr:efflux RND transporter permease subunit [Povalibacter sp.]HMN45553.1 efflux RND transporter permease subunit [Povalibacter sp.]